MRVLVILTELNRYGGTLRFLERLLEIHARRGIETALLAPSGETPDALAALVERHGLEFLRAPGRSSSETAPLLTPYFDLLFCRDAVRSCRPDLLVVSSADPGRMSVALFLSCPALYVLHSVPESRFRLLPRLYLRLGSSLRNQVVTVSDAAALGISQSMGIPLGRISVLRNGCTLPAVVPAPATSAVILTAGHVVDYKNPWLWLEVARKVLERYPEATFIWLGDGPLLDPLRLKVIELALQDRILLPGYVEEPSSWFARARVYFQPSLRESQGIAVEFLSHSPTFRFDGLENTLKLIQDEDGERLSRWIFYYEFQSRHAGYGDRSGLMLAQVITDHRAQIVVEQGEVVYAVLDGRWDELRQRIIE